MLLTPMTIVESNQDMVYDVSYTESITNRFNEARRFTPFSLISTYLSWITILMLQHPIEDEASKEDHMGRWIEMSKKGAQHLLTGVLYLACEYVCSTSNANARNIETSINGINLLDTFLNDTGVKFRLPLWMQKWRNGVNYEYITLENVGYKPRTQSTK